MPVPGRLGAVTPGLDAFPRERLRLTGRSYRVTPGRVNRVAGQAGQAKFCTVHCAQQQPETPHAPRNPAFRWL